jgi:hypothetical protein
VLAASTSTGACLAAPGIGRNVAANVKGL